MKLPPGLPAACPRDSALDPRTALLPAGSWRGSLPANLFAGVLASAASEQTSGWMWCKLGSGIVTTAFTTDTLERLTLAYIEASPASLRFTPVRTGKHNRDPPPIWWTGG